MIKSFDPFYRENTFYEYKLNITKKEKNQIKIVLSDNTLKQYNINNPSDKFHHVSTYERSNNFLDVPLLKDLKKQISDILILQDLQIEMSWAQLYNKGNKHMIHTHESSILSGIVYLNGDSPTVFYSKHFNPYYHKFKKDTLLLFPSHIPHEVHTLNKNEKRIIISFNTYDTNN